MRSLFSDRSDLAFGDVVHDVVAGTREQAYALLFALLCDPHDEVLVPSPGRAPRDLAQLWGVDLTGYPLARDRGGWSYDASSIYEAIGERTRAIVVASPVEPIGTLVDGEAMEAIDALGLPIVIDEAGADVLLDATSRARAEARSCPSFAIDAAGAIRIGGPEGAIREARARLAAIARAHGIRQSPEPPHVEPATCRANLARLRDVLRDREVAIPRLDAGREIVLRMPPTRSDRAWAQALAARGVLVEPGSAFELEGSWIALALDAPAEVFEARARRIAQLARRVR